jgi:DNA-binding NarL/FixJ family response regulator
MSLIKVSIIEDDAGFADALSRLLKETGGFECVSLHQSGEDAIEHLPVDEVDVVLVDLGLPGITGSECIRRLLDRSEKPLYIVLTLHEDSENIFESLKAGASGYLLKTTPPDRTLEAIAELVKGGSPMSPVIARKVAQYFHRRGRRGGELAKLTPRESEVLEQLSEGLTDKGIAGQTGLSVHTVRNHVKSIYTKLRVHSRSEATAKFLR